MPDIPPTLMQVTDFESAVVFALALALLVVPWIGAISIIYLWRLYRADKRRPRSWFLFRFCVAASVVEVMTLVIGYLATLRLLGLSFDTTGVVLLAIAILVLELLPSWLAYGMWRLQRDADDDSNC